MISPSVTTRARSAVQSIRPSTARPATALSSRYEGSHVIAVIEGRGVSREVGIATLDRDTGSVKLVQLADSQTYIKTLHQMNLSYPCLVLVPHTAISEDEADGGYGTATATSLLVQSIMDEFPGVPVDPVQRKYWNDVTGLEYMQQLMLDNDERPGTLLAASNKYYALSAICALLKHAEFKLNQRYAAASMRMQYAPVEGTMMIDVASARNLELVSNNMAKRSTHSLYGLMNHTHTPMGARLLRVNILAPITTQAAIEARLEVVEELIQHEDRFTEVKVSLKAVSKMDLDKLIFALVSYESRPTTNAKIASVRVQQMLSLRVLVKTLPNVCRALRGSKCALLNVVSEMISDERLQQINNLISESLNEDATPAKTGLKALNARIYAVRANYNRLLDVARETYKENVGDIFALNRTLSDKHQLPIQLVYQDGAGGFVFTLKKSNIEDGVAVPAGFTNVTSQKGRFTFSSLELQKRNARMKDALDEALLLSDRIVQDLIATIVTDIAALYKAAEAIALLDLLWSFSHISIMRNYVRPEFTGTLAIKGGRHPVMENVQTVGTVVPNDAYCSDASFFQIIQGPNMSGKSTYIRQAGLLVVMAMCGCFVPAEYASFRIHDVLLTRLSNDDDVEKNLSTFANEMSATAMILGLASSRSLVLIDELGRGTAPAEGVGISHAIAEELIKLKCFAFFATHFTELTTTLAHLPGVVNLHLAVTHDRQRSGFPLVFRYRIADGSSKNMDHYGLDLSLLADLPPDVIIEGDRVAKYLSKVETDDQARSRSHLISRRRKLLLKLKADLKQALQVSTLPDEGLLDYLVQLQREYTGALNDTMR